MKMLRKMIVSRNSFTLIELLVVIAIIALLASMLLPSLATAREKVRAIKCVSNMKQLALAIRMYADDWDDYCVPAYSGGNDFWPQTLMLQGYFKYEIYYPRGVFQCPSEPSKNDTNDPTPRAGDTEPYGAWRATHYGMNYFFYSGSVEKFGKVRHPSETMLLMDMEGCNGYVTWNKSWKWAPRHSEGLNVCFVDGHVKWYEINNITSDSNDVFWHY